MLYKTVIDFSVDLFYIVSPVCQYTLFIYVKFTEENLLKDFSVKYIYLFFHFKNRVDKKGFINFVFVIDG